MTSNQNLEPWCDCTAEQMARCLKRPEPFHNASTFSCKARHPGEAKPSNLENLLKRVGARIPASVTPATRIEIHPSEWIELANEVAQLKYDLEMAHGPSGPSAVETGTPQAPIARVTISDDGMAVRTGLYAPGLPPGEHDLYCEPAATAPYMRAEKASERCGARWVVANGIEIPCVLAAGHEGKHRAPEPFSNEEPV